MSNFLWLTDIIHKAFVFVSQKMHDYKYRDFTDKPQFRDTYVFDLGYHQSYSLVIFLNCLIYSTFVPIIPLFAALFFHIKYVIDKYNMIFVYFKEYESGGQIRNNVTNYMVFILFFYMIVVLVFFSLKFSDKCLSAGVMIVFFWTIFYVNMRANIQKMDRENNQTECFNLVVEIDDEMDINGHHGSDDGSCSHSESF